MQDAFIMLTNMVLLPTMRICSVCVWRYRSSCTGLIGLGRVYTTCSTSSWPGAAPSHNREACSFYRYRHTDTEMKRDGHFPPPHSTNLFGHTLDSNIQFAFKTNFICSFHDWLNTSNLIYSNNSYVHSHPNPNSAKLSYRSCIYTYVYVIMNYN